MQLDLFDVLYEDFKLPTDRPIRLFESFAGIGCQKMGIERAGLEVDVVGTSEIDKFAIEAYTAMHGSCPNLGSITDITGDMMPKDIDIFTYSFPCTDLSKAGQQAGMGCGTRSGLVYEVMRILEELNELDNLPQVLIMENVVDLIQAKFVNEFNSDIQRPLELLGYTNYVFTMNARHYGVPQNRDRVFMVSILGDWNYVTPKEKPLKVKLKDLLEEEVDESYYLSDKQIDPITKWQSYQSPVEDAKFLDSEYMQTITAKSNTSIKANCLDIGVVVKGDNAKRTLCNTIIANNLVEEGDMIRHSYTRNRMEDLSRKENENGISATLTTRPDTLGVVVEEKEEQTPLRIRKLTPRETGRLMGISEEYLDKQLEVVSNAQAYKQHGNGIVVDVFSEIIRQMI